MGLLSCPYNIVSSHEGGGKCLPSTQYLIPSKALTVCAHETPPSGSAFSLPETVFERLEPFYSADTGNIVGNHIALAMQGSSHFSFDGQQLEIVTQAESWPPELISRVESVATILRDSGLLGVSPDQIGIISERLVSCPMILNSITSALRECTNAGLTDMFISYGSCYYSTAGYVDLHGRLDYLLHNDLNDSNLFDQLIERWHSSYQFALLNILIFTSRPDPASPSTIEQIVNGATVINERTLSTRPRGHKAANYKSREVKIIKASESLGIKGKELIDTIFNPDTPFIDEEEATLFQIAIKSLCSCDSVEVRLLAIALSPESAINSFKRIISLPANEYRKFRIEIGKIQNTGLIVEKIEIYRELWRIIQEFSGYIPTPSGASAIKSRPDALIMRGIPTLQEGTLRTLDRCYKPFTDEYMNFVAWLEVSNPELCITYSDYIRDANGSTSAIATLLAEQYAEYCSVNGKEPMQGSITLFELKTGEINERVHTTQTRRLLIVLLSLYAELRLPNQSLDSWLTSIRNPLLFFQSTGVLRVGHSVLRTFSMLNEYINNRSDAVRNPELSPAQYLEGGLYELIPEIVREIPGLKSEILEAIQKQM